jgi:siroheme synthase (precorrin-2 oxidase/ferrochelatase)
LAAAPTIIFDFISKTVITAGSGADADRRVQDFIKQQAAQQVAATEQPSSG